MTEHKTGDVVVILRKGGKPSLALYVAPSPSGSSHIVKDGLKSDSAERLVDDVIALERQPEGSD